MTRPPPRFSPGAIVVLRVLNACFFLTVAVFASLSYSPFGYEQFIKPNVLPELTEFRVFSPTLYWLAALATLLTLLPHLEAGRRRPLAVAYAVGSLAAGAWIAYRSPLLEMGNSPAAFVVALGALVWPTALAVHDLIVAAPLTVRPSTATRLFRAAAVGAVLAWASYAVPLPIRLRNAVGIAISPPQLFAGAGVSLATTLFAFTMLALALLAAMRLASLASASGAVEYTLLLGAFGAAVAIVAYRFVCASIAYTGWAGLVESSAVGAVAAVVWASIGRQRCAGAGRGEVDSIELMAAPIAGIGSRSWPVVVMAATPLVAYGLAVSTIQFDWNFLLQKLGVLIVWLIAFAAAAAFVSAGPAVRDRWLLGGAGAVLVVYGGVTAAATGARGASLDQYAALDPSYRLMRDARATPAGDTAAYYAFLRANTLQSPGAMRPRRFDFTPAITPRRGRRPDIFLWVIDSMRRDYLGAYNPRVHFTPSIDALARDSFVFDRAFTHYSGTSLSIPSLWAGGMVIHAIEQPDFKARNTLLRLLDANGYRRAMDMDHIVSVLMPDDPPQVPLDRDKSTMQFDVCTTVDELEKTVSDAGDAPVFFYELAQNVHISIAWRQKPAPDPLYDGFFPPVAAAVRRVDGCIGRFVDFLKRTKRYDDSIVIITADHGDSLGEGGRWGHPFFIVPEVMRIPLVVHLPSWMRDGVAADLSAVSFITDVSPSLYALLGAPPDDRGPLAGRPLFVGPDADFLRRRRDAYLLGSSYAAVYGTLRDNGTRLYAVDSVNNSETLSEMLGDGAPRALEVTRATAAVNRSAIRDQLTILAREYGVAADR